MKTDLVRRGSRAGFTLLEVLFVVLIIGILAMLLVPVVEKGRARSKQVSCGSGLRQLGIAFHLFAHDHQNEFPFQVSTSAGGTKEFLQSANSLGSDFYFAYRHFQPLSNDLSDPRLLVCISDRQRSPATDFVELRNRNISYVLAVSAAYQQPDSVLLADRNILLDGQPLGAVAVIQENAALGWNSFVHESRGNLLFADGRVQGVATLGLTTALATRTGARLISPLIPSSSGPPQLSSGGGGGDGTSAGSPGASGASASPGSSGGGSSGFDLLQQAFSTSLGGPSSPAPGAGSSAASSSGAEGESVTDPSRGARTPSISVFDGPRSPNPEPIPVANVAGKPAAKAPLVVPEPVSEPTPTVDSPAASAHMGTIFTRPQSCWWCWLLMFLGLIVGLIGLAFAIRFRNIRLRRRRALAQFGM